MRTFIIDFETYYDDDYSLRKMSTTEYIQDTRFHATCLGVAELTGDSYSLALYKHDEIQAFFDSLDPSDVFMVGHHMQFDAYIASFHFGFIPAFYGCTQSMERIINGVDVSSSLVNSCTRWGIPVKTKAQALVDAKGKRDIEAELTEEEVSAYYAYCVEDVEATLTLAEKQAKYISDDEMLLIDMTIRMYASPKLVLNRAILEGVIASEKARKEKALASVGIADPIELRSNNRLAKLLEAEGCIPPTKVSLTTGKPMFAFSKSDLDFTALLEHENPVIQSLVEARLAVKSSIVETRAASMLRRADHPVAIYLKHWGASTGRWSGSDEINWQNLPRRGEGVKLRHAICAPDGHTLIIADLMQIEARLLAWWAEQEDIVKLFAQGEDVYSYAASGLYGYNVNKDDNPHERFVGKVYTLGAGYGVGAKKINHMLAVGSMGPPVVEDISDTTEKLFRWRKKNYMIVKLWSTLNNALRFLVSYGGDADITVNGITLEYMGTTLYIHMPTGTHLTYLNVHYDKDGEIIHDTRKGTRKLYGGLLVENIVQALARCVLGTMAVRILRKTKKERLPFQFVMTTHDEFVAVTTDNHVDRVRKIMDDEMRRTPDYVKGAPIDVESTVAKYYCKA